MWIQQLRGVELLETVVIKHIHDIWAGWGPSWVKEISVGQLFLFQSNGSKLLQQRLRSLFILVVKFHKSNHFSVWPELPKSTLTVYQKLCQKCQLFIVFMIAILLKMLPVCPFSEVLSWKRVKLRIEAVFSLVGHVKNL